MHLPSKQVCSVTLLIHIDNPQTVAFEKKKSKMVISKIYRLKIPSMMILKDVQTWAQGKSLNVHFLWSFHFTFKYLTHSKISPNLERYYKIYCILLL